MALSRRTRRLGRDRSSENQKRKVSRGWAATRGGPRLKSTRSRSKLIAVSFSDAEVRHFELVFFSAIAWAKILVAP